MLPAIALARVRPSPRQLLSVALAGSAGLGLVRGMVPYPYTTSGWAEAAAAALAASIVLACAPRDRDGQLSLAGLALICAPLWIAATLGDPSQRSALAAISLAASATITPRFWLGDVAEEAPLFRGALLAMTLLQGAHLVWVGTTTETSYDADAFYYFALARHWVVEGRLEDHMLWHYLAPPEHVVHPVGDYWQPMTSLLLAPAMRLFGPTHAVAGATAAVVSCVGGVALWHLLTGCGVVRHRAIQAALLVAYNCNTELERFRIDAETQGVVSTLILLSMVALAHRRVGLAIAVASSLAITRSDASFAAAALILATLVAARPEERPRVLAVVAACGGLYAASHLVRFGTLAPPGAARAPLIATYFDLYHYEPTLRTRAERLDAIVAAIPTAPAAVAVLLLARPFVLTHGVALIGPLVAWGASVRDEALDPARRAIVVSSVAISLFVPVLLFLLAGPVFNEGRTFQGLVAAMHVASAYAADRVARSRRLAPTLGALLGLAVFGYAVEHVTFAQPRTSERAALSRELRELSPALDGHTVMTELSWWVGAETDADAVIHTPLATSASAIAVIDRWHPDRLLVEAASAPASVGPSVPGSTFREGTLGPYRLVPLRQGTTYRLYAIEPAP